MKRDQTASAGVSEERAGGEDKRSRGEIRGGGRS